MRSTSRRSTALAAALALLAGACSSAPTARKLVALEAEAMSADYRGDLEELARLRDTAAALAADPRHGYLARYWSGYASWRLAINGANGKLGAEELRTHLERAAAEMEAAIASRPDFADGYAAASGIHQWLVRFYPGDPATGKLHLDRGLETLKRGLELAPDNPRVLWMQAAVYLFAPPSLGGDRPRALETYTRMVEVAPPTDPTSPLPDWGKPEALMSLAYAHLHSAPPDLDAAEREARAALALQPEWSYVRDILLPQILAAR